MKVVNGKDGIVDVPIWGCIQKYNMHVRHECRVSHHKVMITTTFPAQLATCWGLSSDGNDPAKLCIVGAICGGSRNATIEHTAKRRRPRAM